MRPATDLDSVMGRHAARALECSLLAARVEEWIDELVVGGTTQNTITKASNCSGMGLTEAARGALGHWITIDGSGAIERYQCVVPTTWNCSPRDDYGNPGALDLALTLIAHQAGGFFELNPLGSRLVESPVMLATFKMSSFLAACLILVSLRRYRTAQTASWWLCLTCTILTLRMVLPFV